MGVTPSSGEVKGRLASANEVSPEYQNDNIRHEISAQPAVSCMGERWIRRKMIGNERDVTVCSSEKYVGPALDSCSGSSLQKRKR